jgi:hypothetical protein
MIFAQLSIGLTGVDMLNLKVKDFYDGLIESIDDNGVKMHVYMLHMFRKKTDKEFTTFFSEEAVIGIEKYLECERIKPKQMKHYFPVIF